MTKTTGPVAFHEELDRGIRQRGAELNTTISITTHWNRYGLEVSLWSYVETSARYREPRKVGLNFLFSPLMIDSVSPYALVRPLLDEFEKGLRECRVEVAGL